jgi:hypothetical protein
MQKLAIIQLYILRRYVCPVNIFREKTECELPQFLFCSYLLTYLPTYLPTYLLT